MDEFIHIENKELNGRKFIKVDDFYVDPMDGRTINFEESLPANLQPMFDYITNLIDNNKNNDIVFTYYNLPMIIDFVISELDLYNKISKSDKLLIFKEIIMWINVKYFTDIKVPNLTLDVYQDIMDSFNYVFCHQISNLNMVLDVPPIESYIQYFKKRMNKKNKNIFKVIIEIMREVEEFPLEAYQKKLFVLNIIGELSEIDDNGRMRDCYPLYSNFIDTIIAFDKRFNINNKTLSPDFKGTFCCFPIFWNPVRRV